MKGNILYAVASRLRGLDFGIAITIALLIAASASAQLLTDAQISTAAGNGAAWLISVQNEDGSWGQRGDDTEKMLFTAETVRAFRALDLLGPNYLHGITWLENHTAPNSDLAARRIAALAPHQDTLLADLAALRSEAMTPTSGWGLTHSYSADPLDTALVMLSLGTNGATFQYYFDAITSLKDSVIDHTWTIGQPDTTLTFEGDLLTTVAVASTLRACNILAPSLCDNFGTQVFLSPVEAKFASYNYQTSLERALIAGYFAPLRDSPPTGVNSTQILAMVSLLGSNQLPNGSWDNDVLTTATAIHAFGSWLRLDNPNASAVVSISNAGLRRAVNASLGNSAMDAVTKGDLWRLTTLDLSYASTGLLSGLASLASAGATNLTTIDISGNACLLSIADSTLHAYFPYLTTIIRKAVGDVNRDDFVDVRDQKLLLAHLLMRATLQPLEQRAADLSQDGRLDVRDLYWMECILMKRNVSALCH